MCKKLCFVLLLFSAGCNSESKDNSSEAVGQSGKSPRAMTQPWPSAEKPDVDTIEVKLVAGKEDSPLRLVTRRPVNGWTSNPLRSPTQSDLMALKPKSSLASQWKNNRQ